MNEALDVLGVPPALTPETLTLPSKGLAIVPMVTPPEWAD
jgi:hypothetical protein